MVSTLKTARFALIACLAVVLAVLCPGYAFGASGVGDGAATSDLTASKVFAASDYENLYDYEDYEYDSDYEDSADYEDYDEDYYDEDYEESEPYNLTCFVNAVEYDDTSDEWEIQDGPICYGDKSVLVSVFGYYGDDDLSTADYEKVKGASVKVKIGKKTYKGKTGSNGVAKVKIPIVKIGTSVKVSFTYDGDSQTKKVKIKGAQKKFSYYDYYISKHGTYADESDCDPYTDGAWDRREKFNANIKVKPTYAANKKTTVVVKQATKGDKIKVKIGKKTYTKKITKSASTESLVIKHPKVKAGTKISVIQYNKYKQKMGTASSIVFSVKKLKKGLTKNQVKYMRTYGSPDSSSTLGGGWWRYDYFNGYSWVPSQTVYFTDGKVRGWTNH